MNRRYMRCTCCGSSYYSDKPQELEFDTGHGRCEACKPRLVADMVKFGWAGKDWTAEAARARMERYA